MPDPTFPNLTVLDHPLIQHKMTLLRNRETGARQFRHIVGEIATLMAYEVTQDLPTEPVEIETPLERMIGRQIAAPPVSPSSRSLSARPAACRAASAPCWSTISLAAR